MRRGTALALATLWVGSAACSGVAVREFTREEYQPAPVAAAVTRVFAVPPDRVWQVLGEVLRERGAGVLEPNLQGRLVVRLAWRSRDEAADAVALGRLRTVVTRTERRYRSWSPFDYDCNDCVVRSGRVVGQHTELLEDRVTRLDPDRYQIQLRLNAQVHEVSEGTRLVLALDPGIEPREPPDLAARSTGRLEQDLLETIARRLGSPDARLR